MKILPLLAELNWNVFETLQKSNLDCPRLLQTIATYIYNIVYAPKISFGQESWNLVKSWEVLSWQNLLLPAWLTVCTSTIWLTDFLWYHHMTLPKHQIYQRPCRPKEFLLGTSLPCQPSPVWGDLHFLSHLLNKLVSSLLCGGVEGENQANDAECPHQHLRKQQSWDGICISAIIIVVHLTARGVCTCHKRITAANPAWL